MSVCFQLLFYFSQKLSFFSKNYFLHFKLYSLTWQNGSIQKIKATYNLERKEYLNSWMFVSVPTFRMTSKIQQNDRMSVQTAGLHSVWFANTRELYFFIINMRNGNMAGRMDGWNNHHVRTLIKVVYICICHKVYD